jgi:hypothetical protein
MSDGHLLFPNCSWVEDSMGISSQLIVTLPRKSLLRQSDQIRFRFTVSGTDQEINSVYSVDESIEFEHQYSTQHLLSSWGLYLKRSESYLAQIEEYYRWASTRGNETLVHDHRLPWVVKIVSTSQTPTSRPSFAPTSSPFTSTPTQSPTLHVSTSPTSPTRGTATASPSKSPLKISIKLPTQSPSRLPSLAPSKTPSKTPTRVPSFFPSADPNLPLLECTVEYVTTILTNNDFDDQPHLKILFPSKIYSPCTTSHCLQNRNVPLRDELKLDASASYVDSIDPLVFSWKLLTCSINPLCPGNGNDPDCSLDYGRQTLVDAFTIVREVVEATPGSSSILRLPNTLLLAGVQYTFQLRAQLNNTWSGKISNHSTVRIARVVVTSLPIPTLMISESYPLSSINDSATLVVRDKNQSFFMSHEVLWTNGSNEFLSPGILIPSDFPSSRQIFTFEWQIFELFPNSSSKLFPKLVYSSHEPYFSVPDNLERNSSKKYLLHLTVVTGALYHSTELSSTISTLLIFKPTPRFNAIILGGSRCAFPDVDLILVSRNSVVSQPQVPLSYRWSCWIVDTYNRDSYNIGKGTGFDPYSQCSLGDEFSSVRHEITPFDQKNTPINDPSRVCRGYDLGPNTHDSTLHIPPTLLDFGVKYKFCVEMFERSDPNLHQEMEGNIYCVGVYIYIPMNSRANHYTGANRSVDERRSLDTSISSWQPFELLTPYLVTNQFLPEFKATKFSQNTEAFLKLTVQTPPPTNPKILPRLTCDSSVYPYTTWGFRTQFPSIFRDHPKIMGILNEMNSHNFVSFPFSTNPSVFGYSSFKFPPNVFSPGNMFTFSISSSCSFENSSQNDDIFAHRGYSEITLIIPQLPRTGRLEIIPSAGISFETTGFLQQSEWIIQDAAALPLQYSFYYTSYFSNESFPPDDIQSSEELLCLQDWSFLPYLNWTFPMSIQFPLDSLFSNTDSTILEFWNRTYNSLEETPPRVVIRGFTRDSNGVIASRAEEIEILSLWETSKNDFTSLIQSTDDPLEIEDEVTQVTIQLAQLIHAVVKQQLKADFYDSYLAQDHLKIYRDLYGMATALNSLPIHFLSQIDDEIANERYELRRSILDFLLSASNWTYSNQVGPFGPLSYTLILTIIQIAALPDELNEISKTDLVNIIERVVSRSVRVATSQSIWGSGYFAPEYCSEIFAIKTVDTITDLLTTLDRIAPIVDTSQTFSRRSDTTLYKQTLLGLKAILIGCSLPGETVGTAGESNYLQTNAILGTSLPTLSPSFLNSSITNENVTFTNNSNSTFSPTNSPTIHKSVSPVMRLGSQIGVMRQSVYGTFSQASVTVGSDGSLTVSQNISKINETITNAGNRSNVSDVSISSVKSSSRVDKEPMSFLQFPCDTRLNSCQQSQIFFSQDMRNEVTIEDVVGLISEQDSMIDVSILNVPILEPSSYEVDGVDRTWVPFQGNGGVSDAVIVEVKTSANINRSFFNLTDTIEVGVKVSRPDVLWKLAVMSTDSNLSSIVPLLPKKRSLRGDDDVRDDDQSDPLLIFSPRWVRCELFDPTTLEWIKPDWLDGWWSPDVASFATETDLHKAAQKYVSQSFQSDEDAPTQTSYLAVNSSVDKLPTSLSCFLNSISVTSQSNETNSLDNSIWLQWRTVLQTQDPCGGCSGHGICVLFRTAPICLCQDNYEGRFCGKYVTVNSTRSSSSRQWHLASPLTGSGLKGIGLIITIVISFILLVQLIRTVTHMVMMKQESIFRPLYSFLRQDQAQMMTISQFLENDSLVIQNRQEGATEERTYSLISRIEETTFSDPSISSTVIVPITQDDESLNQSSFPQVRRSWLAMIAMTYQRYIFRPVPLDDHRDHDEEEDFIDRNEENGRFVTSHTRGNGIEIHEQLFEDSRQTARLQAVGNETNASSSRLIVRGIHHFSQESKSLRDYQRVKGNHPHVDLDRENEKGLRLRKSDRR